MECGALDGEGRSNTLSLERDQGWQGLLIEGDPQSWHQVDLWFVYLCINKHYHTIFLQVLSRHRKAYFLPRCVSTKKETMFVNYGSYGHVGRILLPGEQVMENFESYNVTCYPLFSLLLAMNVSRVDYFSLDVEGWELEVLKTIPFDKIDIKVW